MPLLLWVIEFLSYGNPIILGISVSPDGFPPTSFPIICVMFISILASVTGGCVTPARMAHLPTPGGWGDQQVGKSDWSTTLQDMCLIFYSISWL